jgi:hypothetical protein
MESSDVPPVKRVGGDSDKGHAEQIGDFVLTRTGGISTPAPTCLA